MVFTKTQNYSLSKLLWFFVGVFALSLLAFGGTVSAEHCRDRYSDPSVIQACQDAEADGETFESGSATVTNANDCEIHRNGEVIDGFVTSTEFDGAEDLGDGRYCVPNQQGDDLSSNPIFGLLRTIIQFMSALVGILSVIFILMAGFRYMTAGGNPEATKKARDMIRNVVVGLILYSLMTLIINFLIPGGLL